MPRRGSSKSKKNAKSVDNFIETLNDSRKNEAKTSNCAEDGVLHRKSCKLPLNFFNTLETTLNQLDAVTTLSLQNCRIRADQVVRLCEVLAELRCIVDLNLDMNPNVEKNHYLLCKRDCRLRYLSLKFCNLEDSGVKKIADELNYRDNEDPPALILLNLSHNRITDIGANFVAEMLHTNRSIQSLDLSGNWITDSGALSILRELYVFSLDHEEVVQLRKRKLLRLIQLEKMEVVSAVTLSTTEQRSTESNNSAKESKSKRNSMTNTITTINTTEKGLRTNERAKDEIGDSGEFNSSEDLHPLCSETYPVNGEIIAAGNMVVQHLNLSYNKLTERMLPQLIKILHHHNYVNSDDLTRGLLCVNLEGNNVTNELRENVQTLLQQRLHCDEFEFDSFGDFVPAESKILRSRMNVGVTS